MPISNSFILLVRTLSNLLLEIDEKFINNLRANQLFYST